MKNKMSQAEFIAFTAMMFATIAFSLDSMLPALPEIGAELSPDAPNRAALILTSFVFGMGAATFFTGPLSDAFGRKPVILGGAAIYIAASFAAWASSSLEVVLAARVLQGIGAAGPRVVALAIVRDLYAGRDMARIISIAMMIFTIFPAFAPLMGAGIIAFVGWRGIFLAFVAFSVISILWMTLRLPETLARDNRRPIRVNLLVSAVRDMFTHPVVRMSILVQALCMGILFTVLTMVQPIYEVIYGRGDSFPYWFGGIAMVSASASLLNAAVVGRVGMRRMVTWSLGAQICITGIVLGLIQMRLSLDVGFAIFVIWQTCLFFMAGTTIGNLNAIAMEPMGHIAGMAASVIGSVATVLAAAIASPISQLFDGTLTPFAVSILVMSILAFVAMRFMGRAERRLTT